MNSLAKIKSNIIRHIDMRSKQTVQDIISFQKEIYHLLEKIVIDLQAHQKSDVKSPYLNFFLKQVTRYNGPFKKEVIRSCQFMSKVDSAETSNQLKNLLIQLRGQVYQWKTFDEEQREEGHLETTLLIVMGLLDDNSFRKEFTLDCQKLETKMSHRLR